MEIGSITSAKTLTVTQVTPSVLKDQKSKSIQNEITEVRQQMQKLSSKEDLSAKEKTNERKKLQKEISGLTTETASGRSSAVAEKRTDACKTVGR